MPFPITTTAGGICFAFPDVCKTPTPGGPVPIPYPNVGQLSAAEKTSDGTQGTGVVRAGGKPIVLSSSEIKQTSGDEPGSVGGVRSGTVAGNVTFPQGSKTVAIHGKEVVRMLDPTEQNNGNAKGLVLGGLPTVLVGG